MKRKEEKINADKIYYDIYTADYFFFTVFKTLPGGRWSSSLREPPHSHAIRVA